MHCFLHHAMIGYRYNNTQGIVFVCEKTKSPASRRTMSSSSSSNSALTQLGSFPDDDWFDAHANELAFAVESAENEAAGGILVKVVSGGQTGADRAALEAAKACGISTGGFAPRGFWTTAGQDLALQLEFGLQELEIPGASLAAAYALRSQRNVDISDATVVFRHCPSVGTDRTIGFCVAHRWTAVRRDQWRSVAKHRPILVITDLSSTADAVRQIVGFLKRHRPRVLNVCGHRDDKTARLPGFSEAVKQVLTLAFRRMHTL